MTRTSETLSAPVPQLTPSRLTLRNLRYFRAANLAVAAGMVVGTAVLTGALLVGDSVRGSLRALVGQRLGPVEFALVAPHFFGQSLADRVATGSGAEVVPAIVRRGGASSDEHHAGGVQIAAVGGGWQPVERGEAVLNDMAADAVGVRAPDAMVLLNLSTAGDVPRDATLARRSVDEITAQARVRVAAIASEPGFASLFSLEGGQRVPRNAWMNFADLQRDIRQPGRVNVLLGRFAPGSAAGDVFKLNETLRRSMTLDDYGLTLTDGSGGERVLGSRTTYIRPAVDAAAERVARRISVPLRRVSVQLINNVVKLPREGSTEAAIHYAVAAGVSALPDGALAADELVLNEWAAQRLRAAPGDRVRLDYYRRAADGQLEEVRSDRQGVEMIFRVSRVMPMSGLGADRTLTPDYPGLTDKATIREAPPELGIREELLTDEDDQYWQQYRAAPKLFVSLDTAQRLWGEGPGQLTSIRIPAARAAEFERELLGELDPASVGLSFRPIRAEQLSAATGSTDFSMLFVGLSFFLIASAGVLVAMLFRLAVEQRARQFGVFQAMGFTPGALYRMTWAEGMTLALVGSIVGLGCAIGYTWLMIAGLRTWWADAVGTTALRIYVEPRTLLIGLVASLVIAAAAVTWAARALRRVEPVRLLSGRWNDAHTTKRSAARVAAALTILCAAGGTLMVLMGVAQKLSNEAAFFGGGALLLLASLCAVHWFVRSRAGRATNQPSLSFATLGMRGAAMHPPRTLLTVSLVAFASFLLVAVAGMRQGPIADAGDRRSGTGGYHLIVHADVPLLADLNTPQGRAELGMRLTDAPVWQDVRFTAMRRWAGQDASCLNLTRPTAPTILSVSEQMIRDNRFSFVGATERVDNPWTLLERPAGDDIPMIADAETARYILKLGLGETLSIQDQDGRARNLRLVAMLKGSIFQSELLIGEASFKRLFPSQSGAGVVLVDTSAARANDVSRALADELEPFAVTVERTADRLAAYQRVANTYLSTFQTLGSLGLLLGTIGLAVVLLRGLFERRAEVALLAAIGFKPAARLGLIVGENATLLLVGLAAGTACALVAVLPRAVSSGQGIQIGGLTAALTAVLVTGLAVLALAAWLGGRNIAPADLRRE